MKIGLAHLYLIYYSPSDSYITMLQRVSPTHLDTALSKLSQREEAQHR